MNAIWWFIVAATIIITMVGLFMILRKPPVAPKNPDAYNTYTDTKALSESLINKSLHVINYVASSYNDLYDFPMFQPSGNPKVTRFNTNLKTLGIGSVTKAGLVYEFDSFIVVAFRGTSTDVDVKSDVEWKPYTYPGTSISVHGGFYRYYQGLRDELLGILGTTKKKLYLTGHSLGSGVALICARDLKDWNPTVIVYACPKSGNRDFIDSFKGSDVLSITNYFDVVPDVPEEVGKFFAVRPIYIFGVETASDMDNHSIEVYNKGIPCMQLLNSCDSKNVSQ